MRKVTRLISLAVVLAVVLAAWWPAGAARAEAYGFGVTYKSSTVNLRQQPTQYSTRLGSYPSGSWMAISGESGNWYYVTAPDGRTGYMSKNYVQTAQDAFGTIGVVANPKATSFLNLRQSPSYSAKVLAIYYNGVPFVLLSHSGDGWYRVRVNGLEGYFREEFITTRTCTYSEEVATIVTPGGTGLNLRTGPGMGYASIGQYRGGCYVMVLQKGSGWWRVSVDGQVGFMNSDFLREGILTPEESLAEGGGSTGIPQPGYALVANPRATQVLNLREQPSTTSRVLGQYRNGERLTVLAQGAEWCRVMDEHAVVGYMMTDYLSLRNLPATPTMTVNHPQKSFVNLRTGPSTLTGSVLVRLPHGAKVTVLVPGDSWVKIRYNGYTGYAMSYFLK